MQFALIALLAVVQQGPAATEATSGAEAVSAQTKESKKICRRQDADTGSRLNGAKKVCRTIEQWRAEESRSNSGIEKLRRDSY